MKLFSPLTSLHCWIKILYLIETLMFIKSRAKNFPVRSKRYSLLDWFRCTRNSLSDKFQCFRECCMNVFVSKQCFQVETWSLKEQNIGSIKREWNNRRRSFNIKRYASIDAATHHWHMQQCISIIFAWSSIKIWTFVNN